MACVNIRSKRKLTAEYKTIILTLWTNRCMQAATQRTATQQYLRSGKSFRRLLCSWINIANSYADCLYPITAVTPLAHYATLHSVCSPPDAGYCPPHISSSKHSVKPLY